MQTRITTVAMNSLLVIDGVSAWPSPELHDTGLIMVIPPQSVFIVTGINMGPVIVDVEPRDGPPSDARGDWEDVAEFTAQLVTGVPMTVRGEMELPSSEASDLAPDGAATVRIRVSATGRDVHYDLAVSEPSEHYLVQIWTTSEENGPVQWRTTSNASASRRASRPVTGSSGATAG